MESWEKDDSRRPEERQPSERHRETALRQVVARRAYHLWQSRGCPEGSAQDDWLQAEGELQGPGLLRSGRREVSDRGWPSNSDSLIDEASEESFPASDAPGWTRCSCG